VTTHPDRYLFDKNLCGTHSLPKRDGKTEFSTCDEFRIPAVHPTAHHYTD